MNTRKIFVIVFLSGGLIAFFLLPTLNPDLGATLGMSSDTGLAGAVGVVGLVHLFLGIALVRASAEETTESTNRRAYGVIMLLVGLAALGATVYLLTGGGAY